MCIILFAYKTHPKYSVVLAANRDEYYSRPTSQGAFWEDAPDILAGRDLEQGGTWLGVTRSGKYAAVTNFRDPSSIKKSAPSRGFLVSDFLRSFETPKEYLARISDASDLHNGFNLIVGDPSGLYYFSNKAAEVRNVTPGIYGLSNHLIDTPWPKVEKGKDILSEVIREGGEIVADRVFEILSDSVRADDASLPHTGIGLEYERALSSIFISTPIYGTRSSTVLLIDVEGTITFIERTFELSGPATDVNFHLQIRNSVISSR